MGTRPQPRPQVASLPLALPLVACCNVVAAFDDWKDVTKKRLPVFYYMYDTEEQNAGSTLALLRGVPSVVRGGAVAAVSVVVPPFAVADRAPG